MSGAQNAIIGDNDPLAIPETEVPVEELTEEKKLAQYSQSEEYKRLSDFMKARIQFYQRFLPNGSVVEGDPVRVGMPAGVPAGDLGMYWTAACIVIKEFEGVLASYDQANEAVKNVRPSDS